MLKKTKQNKTKHIIIMVFNMFYLGLNDGCVVSSPSQVCCNRPLCMSYCSRGSTGVNNKLAWADITGGTGGPDPLSWKKHELPPSTYHCKHIFIFLNNIITCIIVLMCGPPPQVNSQPILNTGVAYQAKIFAGPAS